MTQVVTFLGYTPIARYDAVAWSTVRIEEAAAATGPWTQIDEIALSPLDSDPSDPQTRNFTTSLASDTPLLWYRAIFADAGSDTEQPTAPIQNGGTGTPYSTVTELARILKIRAPTAEQTAAMERVLAAAAGEINSEIDLASDADPLTGWQLSLVEEVNLERAVEHWQQEESPFGVIGLGSDVGGILTARNSWERHAQKLAPLKSRWGIA